MFCPCFKVRKSLSHKIALPFSRFFLMAKSDKSAKKSLISAQNFQVCIWFSWFTVFVSQECSCNDFIQRGRLKWGGSAVRKSCNQQRFSAEVLSPSRVLNHGCCFHLIKCEWPDSLRQWTLNTSTQVLLSFHSKSRQVWSSWPQKKPKKNCYKMLCYKDHYHSPSIIFYTK